MLAPDIATFSEQGFPKVVVQDWTGFLAPETFAETVRESWERYRDIVKETGFKVE